ncbi:calcium-binding protein [Sinorhizobium chiapasense]|uniref:Calcium-binding protein n=1 Tax=Sinorhizobium chiapasense TaxID=501572 RepID=A0ABZ2BKV2_9HYPH
MVGSKGDDRLRGGLDDDRFWGLPGDDDLDGGEGNDHIDAGAGNDLLTSASGFDRLVGGDGDDEIVLLGIGGAVTGGAGVDTLVVDLTTTSEPVRFNGVSGHGMIGGGSDFTDHIFFSNIERLELTTGNGADFILGTAGNDSISTVAGNDVIGTGRTLDLGASALGDDVVDAGDGNDLISDGIGANRLYGGAGDDVVTTTFTTVEAAGGDGDDLLSLHYYGEPQGIALDLEQGMASTGLRFSGFEHAVVFLGSGNDLVIGSSIMQALVYAGEGDNVLVGGSGADHFQTGSGDDMMFGKGGDDTLVGYGGADTIDGGDGNDLIWLVKPEGTIEGGAGEDTLYIAADGFNGAIDFDAMAGSMGSSLVFTGVETFRVVTNDYYQLDDTLRGGAGNDFLTSNNGEDLLDGRAGDDELRGGGGADRLIGGTGADTFIWGGDASTGNGVDHIIDFDPTGGDVLRFEWDAQREMDIHDFEGFLSLASDTGTGVFVSFGRTSSDGILLEGVARSDFAAGNVDFFV